MAPKSKARRPYGRRRKYGKRRMARRGEQAQWATVTQTLSLQNDSMNTVFRLDDINLSQFDRATQVARAYQYFRIKKVHMTFKPFMDTYTNGAAQSVPYLYYLLMKGDNLDAGTFGSLRDAGAKPIRFDDKSITVSWVPYVQQAVIGQDTILPGPPPLQTFSMSKRAPWLSTTVLPAEQSLLWQPSTVPHKGILYGVQEDASTITQYYECTLTVEFQFKKANPFINPTQQVPSVPKLVIDKEDVPPPTVAVAEVVASG